MKQYRHMVRKYAYIKYSLLTMFLCMLFVKGFTPIRHEGDNTFHVKMNGVDVGSVASEEQARELLSEARRNLAKQSDQLLLADVELGTEGEEIFWGALDKPADVIARMEEELKRNELQDLKHSYTVKIDEYMVSLAGLEDVKALLNTAVDKYDEENQFLVELVQNTARELNVLKASVVGSEKEGSKVRGGELAEAGIQNFFTELVHSEYVKEDPDFEDFELGLMSVDFAEEVEIAECYLPAGQITGLEQAIDEVVKEQETPSEYEVVAGDTLSEISIAVNIPMDKIVEMNDSLEDINTPIRVGQKLIVTVPEPELSVISSRQVYLEEIYDEETIYVDNDDWFTNQTEVMQQPSAGFRKIVAVLSYRNDKQIDKEIMKQEVVMEAVPKIVMRGTKIPPTYIKPISGGRLTSGFGSRTAPTKGATSYHKGVDWATPMGTPVYASCGGTVAKAGWGGGYGYVIFINHADGRQTRYAHLSKVQVKVGQTVKQGEQIALSGSTGVSTGPHVHFEILINGKQVNPLSYLN